MAEPEAEKMILSHMTEQIEEEKIVLGEEEFASQEEEDVNKSQVLDPIASKVAKRDDVSQDDHQQNKRIKTDFDYCMEQVQYWITKAAEIHPEKAQDCHMPNNQTQVLTSGRPWSRGRKFLTCNMCDAFLWKEDAEKWMIKENAKKFEKGHGTLKLTMNTEVPIVIEGNAEDVTKCALKLAHGCACSKQTG